MRTMGSLVAMLLLTALLVPVAAAQETPSAAQAFVADETAAATADPVNYVDGNASADGLDRYQAETAKLACLATLDAEDATGQDIPEGTDPCPVLADAVGAAADEAEGQAPAAEATPLEDGTAERLDAYAEELAADVDAIVADAASAPEYVPSLLDRTLALLDDLLSGLGTGMQAAIGLPLIGAGAIGLRALDAIDAAASASAAMAMLPVHGVVATGDAISQAIGAARAAARDGTAETVHAMTRTLDDIGTWIGDLFGAESARPSTAVPEVTAPTQGATDIATGLLDGITDTQIDTGSLDG